MHTDNGGSESVDVSVSFHQFISCTRVSLLTPSHNRDVGPLGIGDRFEGTTWHIDLEHKDARAQGPSSRHINFNN